MQLQLTLTEIQVFIVYRKSKTKNNKTTKSILKLDLYKLSRKQNTVLKMLSKNNNKNIIIKCG